MRIILITLLYILFGISITYGGRHFHPLIENIGLWISFFALVYYRKSIATLLENIRLPRFVIYIASALPCMLVEENINCQQSGCALIPSTIPILIFFLIIIYFVTIHLKTPRFWYILGIACVVGLLLELFFGSSHTAFLALSLPWFAYISLLVMMSCAYFIVIPLTYLINTQQKNRSHS